jgi:transcriptional regulator with XRE-family HTH domain
MKSTFSPEYAHFRNCIIEARKAAKLTQAKLAELLDKPQSYVAKYENGERRIDVVEFLFITKALGVDPCVLLKKITGGLAD